MSDLILQLSLPEILNRPPFYTVLSNQNLKSINNSYGGGFLILNGMTITSQRRNSTDGIYFYIKNVETGEYWNTGIWPSNAIPEEYTVKLQTSSLIYNQKVNGIESSVEIVVAQDENIEIRKITLKNTLNSSKKLEITSYADIVLLDDNRKDLDHPQFHNLFVQSKLYDSLDGILFTRRAFNSKTPAPALFHKLICNEKCIKTFETNRENFIGRLRTLQNPIVMEQPLTNFEGDVLDPCVSVRTEVEIQPEESKSFYFITVVDSFVDNVVRIAQKYSSYNLIEEAFNNNKSAVSPFISEMDLKPDKIRLYQRIGSMILAGNTHSDLYKSALEESNAHVDSLWKYSISGDNPILLIVLDNTFVNDLVNDVVNCHEYLFKNGYDFDIVFLDETGSDAWEKVQNQIAMLGHEHKINQNKGIYILNGSIIDQSDTLYLKHFAQLIVNASNFNSVLSNG